MTALIAMAMRNCDERKIYLLDVLANGPRIEKILTNSLHRLLKEKPRFSKSFLDCFKVFSISFLFAKLYVAHAFYETLYRHNLDGKK